MQKETLANGEKKGCPRTNFAGSFLQPNIAEKIQRNMPNRKTILD